MTTPSLLDLAHEYITAKELYDELCNKPNPIALHERVAHDLAIRRALRVRIDTEDAYNAALDATVKLDQKPKEN